MRIFVKEFKRGFSSCLSMVYLKDVPVNIGTIRFNGIVDLSGLFKIMRDWLVDHEYEFYEKTFKSKAYPEGIKRT